MRIDVVHRAEDLERELDELYRRMQCPGHRLHGMATLPLAVAGVPGLVLRHRVADGEHYIYAEDVARRRLAGYTVFNRLVELGRRADRCLRAPHSKYAPDYQRRGIATTLYRWWLQEGNCLISGARQSAGAHALWQALARERTLLYVALQDKELQQLPLSAEPWRSDDFHTRMILLGAGWSAGQLVSRAGMLACDGHAQARPRACTAPGRQNVRHRAGNSPHNTCSTCNTRQGPDEHPSPYRRQGL